MLESGDLRKGLKLEIDGDPYVIVQFDFVKPGKGQALYKCRLKNMITGTQFDRTFRSGEKFGVPDLESKKVQYLYSEDGMYQFMDQEDYEQYSFDRDQLGEARDYLKENEIYKVLFFAGKPIAVEPPTFMELVVTETIPGVKGDTAQGGSKPATLETGVKVQVPLFINEGDKVKIDTREAKYIERC